MKKIFFFGSILLIIANTLFAGPRVIFVNDDAAGSNDGTGWTDAFTTLQAALDNAVSGDQIWIAAGTYYPTSSYGMSSNNNRLLHFRMKEHVQIYGGFAGYEDPASFDINSRNFNLYTTILSGDVDIRGRETDNSFHVIYHPEGLGLTGNAMLDGVTITDGYGNGSGEHENCGGGICNIGSSPTFSNVIIAGNFANIAAGMYNDCSSPTLYKVTIRSNSATVCAGIYNTNYSLPRMVNVDISDNSARGSGAIVNENSSPQLANVTISNNNGGGIDNINSNSVLINSIISGNSSSYFGGGIYNKNSSPVLTNVTITGNSSSYSGGGIYNENSSPVLNNCIIWDNAADVTGKDIYSYQSVVTLNYCCYGNQIYGGAPVANNCITSDPKFVYPVNGDYRICGNSPCVNAGKNEYNNMSSDIRGKNRIQNDIIDMGAYEWSEGTDPLLLLKDMTIYLDSLGNASIIPSDLVVETSAAVDTLTDINRFDCSNLGDNEVVVTLVIDHVTSIHGKATVTVLDTIPPTFSAPADTTIYTDAGCQYNANVLYTGDVTDESDACCSAIEAVFSDEVEEGDCPGNHIITRTWSLADNSGNTAIDHVQIIHVLDSFPPEVVCNSIDVYLRENGHYVLTGSDIEDISAGTTDNCTIQEDLEFSVFPRSFECVHIDQNIAVEVVVTDLCGNQASAWTTVAVKDTIAPNAICQDIEVFLDQEGEARIFPYQLNSGDGPIIQPGWSPTYNDLAGGSFDVCGISAMSLSKNIFGCSDIGDNSVTLTVFDASGNQSTCTSVVTVMDTLSPEADPVSDIVIVADAGKCYVEMEYPEINFSDNCDVSLEQLSGLGEEGLFPLGTTTETWRATDAAGNTAILSFSVTVTSVNAPPTLDEINDIFVNEDAGAVGVTLTGIGYGDDCEAQEIFFSAVSDNDSLFSSLSVNHNPNDSIATLFFQTAPDRSGSGIITINLQDSEGELTTRTFTLTVYPLNDPPYLVNPVADQTVHAGYILKVPISSMPGEMFDDNDDPILSLNVSAEGTNFLPPWATMSSDTFVCQPSIADTGCLNIIVKASDAAGETVADTFLVCVEGYPVNIGYSDVEKFKVQMYPNPTNDFVHVRFNTSVQEIKLSITDMNGKVIFTEENVTTGKLTFNMAHKPPGIYLVRMRIDNRPLIRKLVVKR